jgi:phospholipase/lecithinase/hemolysin
MKQSIVWGVGTSAMVALGLIWADGVEARTLLFRQHHTFGDSLSDPGNVYTLTEQEYPPSPPYFKGRFSDGPVWVEYFNQVFELAPLKFAELERSAPTQGVNFALGGATSSDVNLLSKLLPGLQRQIDTFSALDLVKRPPTLFSVWIGALDYLSDPFQRMRRIAKVKRPTSRFVPQKSATETVGNISNALTTLADSGAKTILVFNLPDLGKIPLARQSSAATSEALTRLSEAHNAALETELITLGEKYSETQFISVDVNALFKFVSERPNLFQLSNVTDSCLNTNATPPTVCANPDRYLFWDDIHPTTAGHQLIAKYAIASLIWPNQEIEPEQVLGASKALSRLRRK